MNRHLLDPDDPHSFESISSIMPRALDWIFSAVKSTSDSGFTDERVAATEEIVCQRKALLHRLDARGVPVGS